MEKGDDNNFLLIGIGKGWKDGENSLWPINFNFKKSLERKLKRNERVFLYIYWMLIDYFFYLSYFPLFFNIMD